MDTKQHKRVTANVIKHHTDRIDVPLLALNWLTDEKRKEYYSSLDKEDLAHNIDSLFTDLMTIQSMLHEEVEALREYRHELSKGDTKNVQ